MPLYSVFLLIVSLLNRHFVLMSYVLMYFHSLVVFICLKACLKGKQLFYFNKTVFFISVSFVVEFQPLFFIQIYKESGKISHG